MSSKGAITIITTIIFLLQFYFLFKIYSYSKRDPFEYEIKQNEKENYFIDTDINKDLNIYDDKECITYQNLIMDKKAKKLGDVFYLNLNVIHSRLTGLLVITIFNIVCLIIMLLIIIIIKFISSAAYCCLIIVAIIKYCLDINGILILCYFILFLCDFYHGDINTYIDFLSCPNVNSLGFRRYRIIELFKYNYEGYILMIIINCIFSCIKACTKENNNPN